MSDLADNTETIPWHERPQDYRRGFVDGEAGELNAYGLEDGATDWKLYMMGFTAGFQLRLNRLRGIQ